MSMNSKAKTRTAAFLVVTSLCLVVEGVSRINLFISTPSGKWGGNHTTYPPAVELAASCGMTFFGLAGLANGLTVMLLGNGSVVVTIVLLLIELPLGWFFFSVFVLSSYPFMVARAAAPMPGLTSTQSDAVIMMGYLGAWGIGIPILAGHFYFHLQMLRFQRNKQEVYSAAYSYSRVYFYAFLVFLRGVGEIAVGSIVTQHLTSGMLPSSIGDVPFVITWGPINIADGIIVLLISLMAIAIAILHLRSMAVPFAILSFFCYVVQLALIATTQIGVNAKNPIIVGPVLAVDTFVATFMPAYLILEAGRVGHLGDDSDVSAEKEGGRPISPGALQSP